jgi:hypothetical protein
MVATMRCGPSAACGTWSADGASLHMEVQTLGGDDAARVTFALADKAVEVTHEASVGFRTILKGRTDD